MTTAPAPARLRELAANLHSALTADPRAFADIPADLRDAVTALRLYAGTHNDYDRQPLDQVLRDAYDRINNVEAYGMHGDILRRDALRPIVDLALANGVDLDGQRPTAVSLPDRSIVATRSGVHIKRVRGVGTPGFESYWLGAESYAIAMDDAFIQQMLDSGEARILRVGEGW